MQICRVVGTVVSTNKAEKLSGMKLLLVRPIALETFAEESSMLVSVDTVGAGVGEVVMVVSGSSSRQTCLTEDKPVDNAIVGIIDHIDVESKRIFDRRGSSL